MNRLTLLLGLLVSSCTAAAPAFAQEPPWITEQIIQEGRFRSGTVNIILHCPSGVQFRLSTNDLVLGMVTASLAAGATSRGEYLEWLGRYDPEMQKRIADDLNECFLGKPNDA